MSKVIFWLVVIFAVLFVLRLVNDRDLMGSHTNGRVFNALSYATTAILIGLTVALLAFSIVGPG